MSSDYIGQRSQMLDFAIPFKGQNSSQHKKILSQQKFKQYFCLPALLSDAFQLSSQIPSLSPWPSLDSLPLSYEHTVRVLHRSNFIYAIFILTYLYIWLSPFLPVSEEEVSVLMSKDHSHYFLWALLPQSPFLHIESAPLCLQPCPGSPYLQAKVNKCFISPCSFFQCSLITLFPLLILYLSLH